MRGRQGCLGVDVVVQILDIHHRHWQFCCFCVETGFRTGRWYPLYVGFYGLALDCWFGRFDFRHDNVDHVDHCPWTLEAISPSFSLLPKPTYQGVLTFTLLQLGRLRWVLRLLLSSE